jgi:NAD-dependent DNA ligase
LNKTANKDINKVSLPEYQQTIFDTIEYDLEFIDDNNDISMKNIYFFFSTLDTKGLGEKVIEKLFNSGCKTVSSILNLNEEKLTKLQIDGFKEKTIKNILNAIKIATTNVPLAKIMAGSNKFGHGLGYERMKQILNVYPDILDDYKKDSKELISNIVKIDGWDTKTATLFATNLPVFIEFYNSIKKFIIIKYNIVVNNTFSNKIFVFSGFRDKNLENQIETLGGKIGSTISKNTDYLVIKDMQVTVKITKAQELGIKIITIDKLTKML